MSPTIVLKNDEPYLMLGASGGPRIISSVLNVFLQVADQHAPLILAMLARRPHHQWQPGEVHFDANVDNFVREELEKRGHKIAEKHKTGIVQAILRDGQEWVGASDPRKGGKPAGR